MIEITDVLLYRQYKEELKIKAGHFWNFGSSMLFNFVLVWLYTYLDLSVTDESYVDETRVWRTKL